MKAPWLIGLLPLVMSCDDTSLEKPVRVPFPELFQPEEEVRLDETPSDPVVGVERITVGPGGELVVPDRQADRVRLFHPDGRILGVVGRRGSGPGELDGVADAFLDARGRLYTTDVGNGRIMRFDRRFRFDTSFVSPGVFTYRLLEGNGELIAAAQARGREAVWRLDYTGRRKGEFRFPDSAAWSVPYWGAVLTRDMAMLADTLFVSNSLLYPLWRVEEADQVDSVGYPPLSFREASRPVRGRFVGARQEEVQDWLRTFTVIDRVVPYRDSLLFVVHAEYQPEPGRPWRRVHRDMDVYDGTGTKLYSEVALPGRVLSGGEHLYILTNEPPAGWVITRYRWASDAKPK